MDWRTAKALNTLAYAKIIISNRIFRYFRSKQVRGWLAILFCLEICISSGECAITFPASPCANSFAYEDDSASGDRWYGELAVNPTTTVTGLNLRITLDRPSHLLAVNTYTRIYTCTANLGDAYLIID